MCNLRCVDRHSPAPDSNWRPQAWEAGMLARRCLSLSRLLYPLATVTHTHVHAPTHTHTHTPAHTHAHAVMHTTHTPAHAQTKKHTCTHLSPYLPHLLQLANIPARLVPSH